MKIEICGYKNLENISLNISERKINMIFGMSGSGKSSISSALNHEELDINKTIGKEINQIIKINDSEELPKISTFNKNTLDNYLIQKDKDEALNVLVDSVVDIKKAEKSLSQKLKILSNAFSMEEEKYQRLKEIKKDLGSDLTKKHELKSTAKINALEKSLNIVKNRKIIELIINTPIKKYSWIKDGIEYMNGGNDCPFCNRKITKKKNKELNQIKEFEQKPILNIKSMKENDVDNLFENISLTSKGIANLKKNIIEIIKALDCYDSVKRTIEDIYTYDYLDWDNSIELNNQLKKYFPQVYQAAKNVFSNMNKLRELMSKAQENTKKVLNRRLDKINSYLEQMAIPYNIKAEYAKGRIKSYKIVHNDDCKEEDRPNILSEGEKCIISLLMFIFKCKKDNSNLIILDDPASYYDDFRRAQILKILEKELDGRTILILSHDDVYAKYAISDKYKRTGTILFFENFGEIANFIEITKDEFGDFNDFVYQRIINTNDYYIKIINLRLLYEGNQSTHAYKYLSAILHGKDENTINEELSGIGTTEKRVIELIKDKHKALEKVDIPLFKNEYTPNLKNYSIIEKAFIARTRIPNNLEKENLSDELNEFAHINRTLKICLNPYKYTFCTKRLYKFLDNFNSI